MVSPLVSPDVVAAVRQGPAAAPSYLIQVAVVPLLSVVFGLGIAISLLPVLLFLGALVVIDSYKLVRARTVLLSILAGAVGAIAAYVMNTAIAGTWSIDLVIVSRYVAPVVEEVSKVFFLVYLIRSARVGFVVDAAIYGCAVGAGFAVLENVYYLHALEDATLWTWTVRGFGTAIMHGGTAAIFAMVSKSLVDRSDHPSLVHFLPGFLVAVVLHSLFNHFLLPPLISTLLLIVVLPVCMTIVFQQSEKATRAWLGVGFDSDQQLLSMIDSGEIEGTRIGQYLHTLKTRFPGTIIVDMLCLLRLHVELSIRAKGILMMRQAGFEIPPDERVRAKFEELRHLEKTVSPTGMLAIAPILHTSTRDLWQRNMLSEEHEGRSAQQKSPLA